MTNQEYARYTSPSCTSTFKCMNNALAYALNAHNIGKTKIVLLADGETYGVMQNALAKKFFAAGFEQLNYGFEALGIAH